ncbi:DUF393 domain-containing protein [bacterium]|nr:DUF393 domain-containing protein [bacterium]
MTDSKKLLAKPVVLYDGSCKFCSKSTDQLMALDKDGCIDWLDLHDEKVQKRFAGIDWERAHEEIHLIHRDGRVHTGVGALRDIAEMIGGEAGKAMSRAMDIPGIRESADLIYKVISENRHRIWGEEKPEPPIKDV